MKQKVRQRGVLLAVSATAALLGLVYGVQIGEAPVAWAGISAFFGAGSALLLQVLAWRRPRSLWLNLVLGTVVGGLLGGLLGLPAVGLGAITGEVAALLIFALPADQSAVGG